MSLLSPVGRTASSIWLVDQNPLGLEEPPTWWQQLVFDYDKMLRVMPSQREHVYRLCRVVRQEARLGLSQMVVHDHPDTRAMIKFGVVPIASLHPWAIRSNKIIRDLYARDTWQHHGGDVNKIVDDMEAAERKVEEKATEEQHAELDDINSSIYRQIRYGRPEQFDLGSRPDARPAAYLPPLPPLRPASANFASEAGGAFQVADDLQHRNRVKSVTPPEGTVASTPKIEITDL